MAAQSLCAGTSCGCHQRGVMSHDGYKGDSAIWMELRCSRTVPPAPLIPYPSTLQFPPFLFLSYQNVKLAIRQFLIWFGSLWDIDPFENFTKVLSTLSPKTIHISPYVYNYAYGSPYQASRCNFFFLAFLYFWLCRVFIAASRVCLAAVSGLLSVEVCGLPVVLGKPPHISCVDHRLQRAGLVAMRHVGSSQSRDQTCVPCIGRWILNHWTTRETPSLVFCSSSLIPTELSISALQ